MTMIATDDNGRAVPVIFPGDTCQTVAIGLGSVQSAAFGASTRVVRVIASSNCFVVIGKNPVATNAKTRLKADVAEYFACRPADKIAVIQESAAGTLYVTEGENF